MSHLLPACLRLFRGRDDVYATAFSKQNEEGEVVGVSYALTKEPLTESVWKQHLTGKRLIGRYQLLPDSTVCWFAMDFDGDEEDQASVLEQATRQAEAFEEAGLLCYIEQSRSGSGAHVWGFFDEPVSAELVRKALKPLVVRSANFDRLYPVQTLVSESKPYGNLIALPFFGAHAPEGWSSRLGAGVPNGASVFLNRDTYEPIDPEEFVASVLYNRAEVIEELADRAPVDVDGIGGTRNLPVFRDYEPVAYGETDPRGRPDKPFNGVLKLISDYGCRFMAHAFTERMTLPEPQWYAAIQQLTCFQNGREAAHLLSMDYPGYTPGETDAKYTQALRHPPVGCRYIKEHFPELACKDCNGRAPYHVGNAKITSLIKETTEPMIKSTFGASIDRMRRRNRGEVPTGAMWRVAGLDKYTRLRPKEMTVVGALPSIGKCVVGDTMIAVPETGEYITVAEFVRRKETRVVSIDERNRQTIGSVTGFLDDGVKPVFRVTTASGRTVKLTAAHPMLTPTGWRPSGELATGDYVAVPTSIPVEGTLPLPEHVIDLLACSIADGSRDKARITKSDTEIVSIYTAACNALGCEVVKAQSPGKAPDWRSVSGTVGIRENDYLTSSHPVRQVLQEFDVTGLAHEKRIPRRLWMVPNYQLARFIGLLWSCDGWIGSRIAEYGCASEQLARDIQHALLRLGIMSRLSFKENTGRGAWTLGVRNAKDFAAFLERLPFWGVRKQQAENANANREYRRADNLPTSKFPELADAIRTEIGTAHHHIVRENTIRLSRVAHIDGDMCQWLSSPAVSWDEVVQLEYVGEEQVYDMCVAEHHNFVANDIYLHNTALMVDAMFSIAEAGTPALGFSAETGREGLEERLLARVSGVDSRAIRGERMWNGVLQPLTADEERAVEQAAEYLASLPLYLHYSASQPDLIFNLLEDTILREKLSIGKPLVVFYDYLQFGAIDVEGQQSEYDKLSRLSMELKYMAKILRQPVVVFSQLQRKVEADDEPQINWFKGTGRIEADADVAMILTGERTPGAVSRRKLTIVKQRDGDAGVAIDLLLHQTVCRFEVAPNASEATVAKDIFALEPNAFTDF